VRNTNPEQKLAAVGFRMSDEKCATFHINGKQGKEQLLSLHSTTQEVSFPPE
jgi:hypothetical protein